MVWVVFFHSLFKLFFPMRSQFIIDAFTAVLQSNESKIGQILQLKGGWEAWLQVEAALQLQAVLTQQANGQAYTAGREQNYPAPDNALRSDIYFLPPRGASIYFELKVQNSANDDIIKRFLADVAKLYGLNSQTKTNCVLLAGAFMVTFDQILPTWSQLSQSLPSGGTLATYQYSGSAWTAVNYSQTPPKSGLQTLLVFGLG
jgi:hypothetical protein